MKFKEIFAGTLSLALVACQTSPVVQPNVPAVPAAATVPLVRPQLPELRHHAQLVSGAGREQLALQLRFPKGFRTQIAQPEQLAFVRVSVMGDGMDGAVYADQGEYVAVTDGMAEVSFSALPLQNGNVRWVRVEGFDSEQQALGAFTASGWYRSQTGVTQVDLVLNRAQNLLVDVLAQLSETVRAGLDVAALQTLLETAMGYKAQTGEFATDPVRFDAAGIAALLLADGPLPDVTSVQAETLVLQTLSLNVLTPNSGPLAENVRVVVNDALSRPQMVLSGTASGSALEIAGLPPGVWQLLAYNSAGEALVGTTVRVDAQGAVAADSDLVLTGVLEGPLQFHANSYTANGQTAPAMSMDAEGDFVVVWQSYGQDGSGYGIYGQRYASTGLAAGSEFQVSSHTTSGQSAPAVSVDADGDFVVVWQGFGQDGDSNGIYGQRYASSGLREGSEFQVNSYTTSGQTAPAVSVDADGDFVVVWQSDGQDGGSNGIYGQRYASSGLREGSEFQVNSYTTGNQSTSAVSVDADGDFVVVWQSTGQDGSGQGIYGQRYASSGLREGSEFQVNSYTTGNQSSSAVSVDADGDFVVVWSSNGQDGGSNGIYGQRYASSGLREGSEFRVNSYTTNGQSDPAVSVDADGDFVVVWQSTGQDGNGYGIYGQRYASTGLPAGSEFQLNSYTTNGQSLPAVSLNADGDFVVVWQSSGQDGSGTGIYGSRHITSGL